MCWSLPVGSGKTIPWLRADVCQRLACLGVQLDQELNEAGHEGVISTENSKSQSNVSAN